MATTNFVDNETVTSADWFNDVDRVVYDILQDPANQPTLANNILTYGTIVDSTPSVLSQTWNDASDTFVARKVSITDTNSASSSLVDQVQVDGSNIYTLDKDGNSYLSGNLLVGTSSSFDGGIYKIELYGAGGRSFLSQVDGSGSSTHSVFRNDNGTVGSISTSGTSTAFNTSSDYRLKNITGPITNSGEYIDSLKPYEGTWKADGSPFVGLVAHEVQAVSKTPIVTGVKDGDEMQTMSYASSEIIANLIAEVKSLRKRVYDLENK